MDWSKQAGNLAEQYEKFLVPAMFEPCAQLVLDAAGVTEATSVLDVCCGTGVVSRAAAARGARVTGVDLGEGMLAVARAAGGDIDYLQGDATALPVDGGFDVALCQHGLMFVPDKPAAVAELLRAVHPGGTVAIACWYPLSECVAMQAVADGIEAHFGPEPRAMMGMPFSVSPEQLQQLLQDAGAEDITLSSSSFPARFAAGADFGEQAIMAGPVAPAYLSAPEDARAAFNADVAQALAQYADGEDTVAPMTTALAVARRAA